MKKVILTRGLPGSGKSTWAKELQTKFPNCYKRINKDDLRAMLDNSVHTKANEAMVLRVRNALITESLDHGYSVIIDDTNFEPIHERTIRELVAGRDVLVEIQDFSHVPLETCIQRDLQRQKSVGEKVIRTFYNKYLKPKPNKIENDPNLPFCVIFDVDGTLAHMGDRSPYDWSKVHLDTINEAVAVHYRHWNMTGIKIFVLSGRDGVCKEATEKWLQENGIKEFELLMRTPGDSRADSIVKREIFDEHIKGKYNVQVIYDDRDQVVEMWRELGLTVFQVAEGNF